MKFGNLSMLESELIAVVRANMEHARKCGAFTEEDQGNDVLMLKAAIQRTAEQMQGISPEFREALRNYRHF